MTSRGRRWTPPTGQLARPSDIELRGRDESGRPIVLLQRLQDLIVGLGVPAWASGPTAAALHGFDGYTLSTPFHVVVESGHNLSRVGHVIATSNHLPPLDREHVAGVPTIAPTRTLLMLAGMETRERLTAALDGALRDGKTTEEFLHRRIAAIRRSGRSGISAMLAALEGAEITRGANSWLEREFLRLVDLAGLPTPLTQQVLGRRRDRLIRVDFRFTGTPIVVEVLGYRYHRTRPQMGVDAERMNRLQLLGFQVFQFTYAQVVDDPADVIATLAAALARIAA